MLKRVTFLLISLIITIEGDKFSAKYFDKTISLLNAEIASQNEKFKQILSKTKHIADANEKTQLEIVKKEMGDFFDDIDQMVEEEKPSQDIADKVSKQELMTMSSALSILDKLSQNQVLWNKLYKDYITSDDKFGIVLNFLEFSNLVSLFNTNNDSIHNALKSQFCKIMMQWLESMEKDEEAYRNEHVIKIIDDLSIIMIKHYTIDDQVISLAMFVVMNLLNRDSDEKIVKIEKMFNM